MTSEGAKREYAGELGLHPIAVEASSMAKSSDNEHVYFDEDAQAGLRSCLEALRDSEELRYALDSLVHVAAHLKYELGQEDAGHQLLSVAETAAMSLQLQNAGKAVKVQDTADEAIDEIVRFRGEGVRSKRAPGLGEAAPAQAQTALELGQPVFLR